MQKCLLIAFNSLAHDTKVRHYTKYSTAYRFSISEALSLSWHSRSFHISLTYLFTIDFAICLFSKVELRFYDRVCVPSSYTFIKLYYRFEPFFIESQLFQRFFESNYSFRSPLLTTYLLTHSLSVTKMSIH